MSVAIQKLEEELGAPLFERGKSEVGITPLGSCVVEQAQRVLEEAARLKDIAKAGQDPLAGAEAGRRPPLIAPYLLPDLIPVLRERAPSMPLEIEENMTESLEAGLKSGRIDVAILALPFASSGIATEFLYEEPFEVVVPHDPTSGRNASRSRATSSPRSTQS